MPCNPCTDPAENTPENETIQSQIENFTEQFFGTIVKTGSDGVVEWLLPCNLDVGLENNPRSEGEGLACYFLRLFQEGITGATGPQGEAGADGEDGFNAYSVVLASFSQPTLESPYITVSALENPSLLEGLYVFIQTSGWYLVNAVTGGTLSLTFVAAVASPASTITAGKLILPAGPPGQSIQGDEGPQGPQGEQGTPGESFTATNGQYNAGVGTDYNLQVLYAQIDFTNSAPELLLPDEGTYLVTAIVDVLGLASVATTDIVSIKLRNQTLSVDIDASEHSISNLVVDQLSQVVINTIVETDNVNQTLEIQGKCTTADRVAVVALKTVFNYVRIA